MTPIVLASASAARKSMLSHAGVPFEAVPASVDESAIRQALHGADTAEIAQALADAKALDVSSRQPGCLVIGSDQILDFRGAIVSKSNSLAEARALLARLRGHRHALVSAAAIVRDGEVLWRCVDKATLWMRDVSDAFLDAYLAREGTAVLGGVGCYRLEGRGIQLFARIAGDYFSILGMPLLPLLSALRDMDALPK